MHQLSFAFNPRVVRLCGCYKLHNTPTLVLYTKEDFNINNDKHTPPPTFN